MSKILLSYKNLDNIEIQLDIEWLNYFLDHFTPVLVLGIFSNFWFDFLKYLTLDTMKYAFGNNARDYVVTILILKNKVKLFWF